MAIAYMRLEGALQSYGHSDLWSDRGTLLVPTKSAVIGILGSMLGIPYGHENLAVLANQMKMWVRVNSFGGVLSDFQTMTVRLPVKERDGVVFANIPKVYKADGSVEADRTKGNFIGRTELRHKQYLMNSSFTVFLECENIDFLKFLCDVSLHPVYVPYLGRACCIPSFPVLVRMSEHTSIKTALVEDDLIGVTLGAHKVYGDTDITSDDVYCREFIDVPLGSYQYGRRFVSVSEVTV